MKIRYLYKFSPSEDSLFSSLQNKTRAPNLILVTLKAVWHAWYLHGSSAFFHHGLSYGIMIGPDVAKWQSEHHKIARESLEM